MQRDINNHKKYPLISTKSSKNKNLVELKALEDLMGVLIVCGLPLPVTQVRGSYFLLT